MVSVCMATYNGARYLREQIDSILAQLSIDDELIISDDGSTDDTFNIIGGYDDPRIRLLRNRGKHGFSSNFGNALFHAKGEYVFLSDQDDVWIAGKYADVLAKLQQYDSHGRTPQHRPPLVFRPVQIEGRTAQQHRPACLLRLLHGIHPKNPSLIPAVMPESLRRL